MARIKPLNQIAEIKLNTIEDIADNAANEVRDQIRDKGVIKGTYNSTYAAYKRRKGRTSNQTNYIDLTFSGNTLDSYMRIGSETTKNKMVVGFTSKEAANVARGWKKKGYNVFQPSIIKAIEKSIDNLIGKELDKNFDQASGRITITI